jgi:hypothetical protein
MASSRKIGSQKGGLQKVIVDKKFEATIASGSSTVTPKKGQKKGKKKGK